MLLVPTDLSAHARAGVRFAVQLAEQAGYGLTFFYCHPILKPTRWSEKKYQTYYTAESEKAHRALRHYIRNAYRRGPGTKVAVHFQVSHGHDVAREIVKGAAEAGATAICMSSRGAGGLRKLLGSNAEKVIHRSAIPVFVVPKGYRRRPVRNIFYASDFSALAGELKQVRQLARRLEARVIVHHYDAMADVPEVKRGLQKTADRYRYADVSYKIQKFHVGKPLAVHIERDMRSCSASLGILFSNQKRGWFDKVFMSSNAVKAVYNTMVPLLIIPRK